MLQNNNKADLIRLFAEDPDRARRFSATAGGWRLDLSRIPLTGTDRAQFSRQLEQVDLSAAVQRLFNGEIVNPSENRPALHMQLRSDSAPEPVAKARDAFLESAERMHSGTSGLSDLLHIGIGGSDLGPRLVSEALDTAHSKVRVHWLSTLDARRFERLLQALDPERTGVVIASKSFSTEETLTQAMAVRDWLGERFEAQSWAATASPERALAFGLRAEHVLAFPEWTGGRFSLWSSVGVSAAALIGRFRFERLLAGASLADDHFRDQRGLEGLVFGLALMMHFLRRELDLSTLGVISYEPRLALLGDYLQQLVMESLGKGVDLAGQPLKTPTCPLIFGGRGTDLQHSIFQALHQGQDTHPLMLVGSLEQDGPFPDWQRAQLSHLLAQARAFTQGRQDGAAHQRMPGQRPTSLLMTEHLTPEGLGYLLASFEHAVYVLSVLWGINPFDQWGVEEGKRLATAIRRRLDEQMPDLDGLADFI